jgi:outer membrane murein-binding lipoprotein Lpp
MSSQSFAELVRELRLRANGMVNHMTKLNNVGLGQADVDAGLAHATHLETLDAEQESLKAALRAKTAEIGAAQKDARQWRGRVTPLIKVALADQPELWVEFGIAAKK